jgi:hypothetical protein
MRHLISPNQIRGRAVLASSLCAFAPLRLCADLQIRVIRVIRVQSSKLQTEKWGRRLPEIKALPAPA